MSKIKTTHPFEILLILDNSGSMAGLRSKAVDALNEFIASQRQEEGDANVTLLLFGSRDKMTYLFEGRPIDQVPELTTEDYLANGGLTALHDATGKGISDLCARLNKIDKDLENFGALVAVYTDGQENDSQTHTGESVKSLLQEIQDSYKWEATYLAANPNEAAVAAGGSAMGFNSSQIHTSNTPATGMPALVGTFLSAQATVSRASYQTRCSVEGSETSPKNPA